MKEESRGFYKAEIKKETFKECALVGSDLLRAFVNAIENDKSFLAILEYDAGGKNVGIGFSSRNTR